MSDDIDCIVAPFRFLWLLIWPILSMILGIIAGSVMSVVITTTVFLVTLIRTPVHIGKMLCVTVRTQECFEGHLSTIMRIVVCLLVPLVHVVFLGVITAFSASIGTLYYVGKSTKVFYKHEYSKTFKKIESNAKLEKTSYLGKYITACQEYMEDDEVSHVTIYFLKGLVAMFPGLVVAMFVIFPYSILVVAITLYRLPINAYKTMKIALFTVVLKWDLRVVVLVLLPVIHTVFPLVAFFVSLTGSFLWTWFQSSVNIYHGYTPFQELDKLKKSLEEYHQAQVDFVSEQCDRFDHPSGIPNGWDGRSYGLEIERILKWQRDFVICCVVIAVEAPVCLVFTVVVSAIKYIPSCLYGWKEYFANACCDDDHSCVTVLSIWPFHVLAILLLPAGVLVCHVSLVMVAVLRVVFQIPWSYLFEREGFKAAAQMLFEVISDHDEFTGNLCGDLVFFEWETATPHGRSLRRNVQQGQGTASYWDRFVSQCIQTTASLVEDGWITTEHIQSMDPSVIQSIPSVAILTILADSVMEKGLEKGGLKWNIDGTVCRESATIRGDGITDHLWPMLCDVKSLLHTNRKKILTEENLKVLGAMLCSNSDQETEKLKEIIAAGSKTTHAANNAVRTKINRLVLAILRVKPYQERMELIYTHKYNDVEIEEGSREKLPNTSCDSEWDNSINAPEGKAGDEPRDTQPDVEDGASQTENTKTERQVQHVDLNEGRRRTSG